MPLVVVSTSVLPRQTGGGVFAGRVAEVEARDAHPAALAAEQHRARPHLARQFPPLRTSAQGRTAVQPAARAWMIVVVARSTSMTTATPPIKRRDGARSGNRWTWTSLSAGIIAPIL